MKNDFVCKRCGKCCVECQGTIKATPEDIERWEHEKRSDILKYLAPPDNIDIDQYEMSGDIDLFFDPVTEKPLDKCPFLISINDGLTECTIHDTKPTFCRNYHCC